MQISVLGSAFGEVASAYEAANHDAAITCDRLARRLAPFGGMAGDDSTAADFAAAYDEAATASLTGLADLVTAYATVGRMTTASRANHGRANAASTLGEVHLYDGHASDVDWLRVDPAAPPSSLGGDSPSLPAPITWILDRVEAFVWPDADTDRLRDAAAVWRSASSEVDGLRTHCSVAAEHLDRLRSPEIGPAFLALGQLGSANLQLRDQYAALAEACDGYAGQVDAHREEMLDLLWDTLRDSVIIEGIGIVLGAVTDGVSTAVATEINTARIAYVAGRLAVIAERLRAVASAFAATLRAIREALEGLRAMWLKFRDARLGGLSADAGMVRFPGSTEGLLNGHAELGGHTLLRHVGKSVSDLEARLRARPRLRTASTFPDEATAERAASALLRHNRTELRRWLRSSEHDLVLTMRSRQPLGTCLTRGGSPVEAYGARTYLVRDLASPSGYRIVTTYPTP